MTHIIRAATIPTSGAAGSPDKVLEPSRASLATQPEAFTYYTCHSTCQVESMTCGGSANEAHRQNIFPQVPRFAEIMVDDHHGTRIFVEIWQDRPGALTTRVVVSRTGVELNPHFFRLPIADRPDISQVLRTLADRFATAGVRCGSESNQRGKEEV
jgi:hypothetical protein